MLSFQAVSISFNPPKGATSSSNVIPASGRLELRLKGEAIYSVIYKMKEDVKSPSPIKEETKPQQPPQQTKDVTKAHQATQTKQEEKMDQFTQTKDVESRKGSLPHPTMTLDLENWNSLTSDQRFQIMLQMVDILEESFKSE